MRIVHASLRALTHSSATVFALGALAASCAGDFDATRQGSGAKTTLGEELFTTLCDRVGASSFSEDLSGQSYRGVCHKTAAGWPSTKVDPSALPPVNAGTAAAESRRLGVAKVEAMARHRSDLVAAFEATFPDKTIDDPLVQGQTVRFHDALTELTRRFVPLYGGSPYATAGHPDAPLLPASTEAIARFWDAIATSPEAQAAFAKLGARQGYRPLPVTLGAIQPLLAYPRLRTMSKVMVDRFGPGGKYEAAFQHLLAVVQQEMRALEPDPDAPILTVDGATLQPNRARQKLEILSELFLAQDDAFARLGSAPKYVVTRDARGFALPSGWMPGSVPAPFALDSKGYPAVDGLGRFVDGTGKPILLAPPFQTPDWLLGQKFSFDDQGRATDGSGALVFQYLDTSRTLLGSLLTDFAPLVAPSTSGDPQSSLMKTLGGAYVLYGDKVARTATYQAKGDKAPSMIPYRGFDATTSPMVDLTYATGQFLGAPGSDDYLGAILDLHEKHPDKTAEGVSLAWKLRAESTSAKYAKAILPDDATLWDDMAEWIAKVARVGTDHYVGGSTNSSPRGLMSDLTIALADPASVKWLPLAYGPAMRNVDRLTYDPNDLAGAPKNLETGAPLPAMGGPTKPVDRNQPDIGTNRSAFQRFANVIAASSKVKSCNRKGSLVKTPLMNLCGLITPSTPILGTANLTYPLLPGSTIDECALFEIDDLGVFFIDSTLAWNHPRRANLVIKDTALTGILNGLAAFPGFETLCGKLTIDDVLERSTGIKGLTTTPTAPALSRLVFFGANTTATFSDAPTLPDLDPTGSNKNAGLNAFLYNTVEPVGTAACPKDALGVNVCTKFSDTLRGLAPNTFFVSETPWLPQHPAGCLGNDCALPSSGFFEGMRPSLTAFANYQYDPDPGETCLKDAKTGRCAGEQLFVDLVAILDKHWPTSSKSALSNYEEFLAWVFSESGLLATMGDIVPTLRDQAYVSPRVAPGKVRSGLEVTTELLSFLFDQQMSKKLGVKLPNGASATTRNDGTPKAQVTPYDLFVLALRGMDARFDGPNGAGAGPKASWRAARSDLVDRFLLADPGAWKNPATPRAVSVLGRLVREQINANCPDREKTGTCDWARTDLAKKLAAVFEGPMFSAINDLQEQLRGDDEARAEIESLLVYLIAQEKSPDTLTSTLASISDLLQVLHDDADFAPILNAIAAASAPGATEGAGGKLVATAEPGMTHATVKLMKVLLDDSGGAAKAVDRYHVVELMLKNLATPIAPGKQTPLEVLVDTIADIHRIDAASTAHLSADDYKAVATGIKSFLGDKRRGLEQFYCIVKGRDDSAFDPKTSCK